MKKDKVLAIINNSGNDLQTSAGNILKEAGWDVQKSTYYTDIISEKSREIDIIARKSFSVTDSFWGRTEEFKVRLFIECKHIKNTQVLWLWFDHKNEEKARKYAKDNHLTRHSDMNEGLRHYNDAEEVAKTWDKVEGRDDIYDAWNQSVHSLIYFQRNSREGYNVIDLPLVVFDAYKNLYKRESSIQEYSPIANTFQLEIDYAITKTPDTSEMKYFLVDVVDVGHLADFLASFENRDIPELKKALQEQLFNQGRNDSQSTFFNPDPYW